MAGVFMSDFTKKTLAQFGWTEQDSVPENIGEFLLAAKDRSATTTRTDVMVDIEKMLPEDVEKAKQMVAEQRVKDARRKAEEALNEQTKNMTPSVAEAYKKMLTATESPPAPTPLPPEEAAPEIVDDRASTEPARQPEPETTPQENQPAQTRDNMPPLPPIILPFCPRCGWDMRMKYDIEVTEQDKEAFVAILLGNSRFKKKYSFLNDKFIVTIRSLLADENLEIHRQLVIDHQAGELPGENEWFLRMFEYRLACSIESVYDGTGKPLAILPPLDEIDHKPPPDNPLETGLLYLRKYVNTKVLAHEVTRRLVGQQFRRFQRLLESLESMAVEPSFWEGIG